MILALDISKRSTGYAHCSVAGGDLPDYGSFQGAASCKSNGAAGFAFTNWLTGLVRDIQPELIVAERPFSGPGKNTTVATSHVLHGLIFAAEIVAFGFRAQFRDVAAQSWRKSFIGHGRPADPKAATIKMCAMRGMSPKNDDEADAIGIWFHTSMAEAVQPATQLRLTKKARERSNGKKRVRKPRR